MMEVRSCGKSVVEDATRKSSRQPGARKSVQAVANVHQPYDHSNACIHVWKHAVFDTTVHQHKLNSLHAGADALKYIDTFTRTVRMNELIRAHVLEEVRQLRLAKRK